MAGTRDQVELLPLYRAGTAVGASVANIDAMNAISTVALQDRAECFCTDTLGFYQYQQDSAAVVDGVNVIAPLDGGPGRWILLSTASGGGGSAAAFNTQAAWFVDSVNGSDANDGTTALTALQTLPELARRWNGQIFSPALATVTVSLAGTYPTQVLELDEVAFPGPTAVTVQGTMTETDNGTVTAVQAWDGTVAGADGNRGQITDGTQDFTASVLRRVRLLTGANAGAVSNVASLGGGVTVANTGQLCSSTPSTVNPAVNDTYAIETFATVCAGYSIRLSGSATLRVRDIDFTTPVASVQRNYAECGGNQNRCIFFGCRLNATNGSTQWSGMVRYAGCAFEGNLGSIFGGQQNIINSCMFGFIQLAACNATSQAILHEGSAARNAAIFVSNGTLLESLGGTGNFAHAFYGVINGTGTSLVTVEDNAQWTMSNTGANFIGATGNATTNALRVRNGCGVTYVTKPKAEEAPAGVANVVLASAAAVAWAAIPAIAAAPDNAFVNVRQ